MVRKRMQNFLDSIAANIWEMCFGNEQCEIICQDLKAQGLGSGRELEQRR